ncbi:hypothetical protein ACE1CD_21660 [Aerosakkonema sp. BLCC-F183]|uniref:hypothetical protein n=1 Tax=Aerosakkonema sp. BLCC-F183 TaxID=3342834 RepID=UPI0035BA64B1
MVSENTAKGMGNGERGKREKKEVADRLSNKFERSPQCGSIWAISHAVSWVHSNFCVAPTVTNDDESRNFDARR